MNDPTSSQNALTPAVHATALLAALLLGGCATAARPAPQCPPQTIPPKVIQHSIKQDRVRLLLIGDAGESNERSREIFAAAGALTPDAIVLLGDNFYDCGLVSEERWSHYDPVLQHGIPIYPVLGNHDYGCPASRATAERQVVTRPPWMFPARNYSVTFGDLLTLHLIDSVPIARGLEDSSQIYCELEAALRIPAARWSAVAAHHPLYSSGGHTIIEPQSAARMRALDELFERTGTDLFAGGHDHHLELVRKGSVLHVLSGAASRLRPSLPMRRALYRRSVPGFAELEVTRDSMRVRFHTIERGRCCATTEWRGTRNSEFRIQNSELRIEN